MLTEAGHARTYIYVVSLVDTNILVYRFETLRIPHQALIEFVAVVTRVHRGRQPLLNHADARREAEEPLTQFTVLYPNAAVFRTALRGAAAYQLSWFDAHLWAYAEHYGLDEIVSEDFEDGRFYGSVRARNPFSTTNP
jgi:predicted nucleic acid-binding protein